MVVVLRKEQILFDPEADNIPLVVPNRSSSLIGRTLRTELTREDVNQVLVEGFFPKITANERPVSNARTGLRTAGLPYAQDAGITRHLAGFLAKQLSASASAELQGISLSENASFLHPTAVLFNGGVLKSELLGQRLMEVLKFLVNCRASTSSKIT